MIVSWVFEFLSEEIQESPRRYFGFATEERKNTSEVSFDSSEVSFDSSEEIFLASVKNFHFPPSYSGNSSRKIMYVVTPCRYALGCTPTGGAYVS